MTFAVLLSIENKNKIKKNLSTSEAYNSLSDIDASLASVSTLKPKSSLYTLSVGWCALMYAFSRNVNLCACIRVL